MRSIPKEPFITGINGEYPIPNKKIDVMGG